METYSNISTTPYQIRIRNYQGRQHIVVPVVMMVEGVHSGSHGPLLHLAEDLGHFPAAWNGIPVMVGHPQVDGSYVSANSPEVLEQYSIGRIFNTRMETGKLKAEAWIDVQKATAVSPIALAYIRSGRQLEVSIGAFTDEETTTGVYNGTEQYIGIARNHRPDHLALLPGEAGACGWEDGCGIRNNKLNTIKEGTNEMTDDEILIQKNSSGTGIFDGLTANEQGYQERMDKIRRAVDTMDNDLSIHFLEEAYDGYIIYRKRTRSTAELSYVDDAYYRQSYQINADGNIEWVGEPTKVRKNVSYVQVNSEIKKGESDMTENQKPCCLEKVVELINNKLTKYTEADREWLLTLGAEKLELITPVEPELVVAPQVNLEGYVKKDSLKTTEDFLKIAPPEVQDQMRSGLRLHQEHRAELIKTIMTNSAENVWTEDELKAYSTDMLDKLSKQFPQVNYAGRAAGGYTPIKEEEVLLPPGVKITK